jgi:hypothetical protein
MNQSNEIIKIENGGHVIYHDDAASDGLADLVKDTVYDDYFAWNRPTGGFSSVSPTYPYGASMAHDSRVIDSPQLVHPIILDGERKSQHYHLIMELLRDITKNVWGKYDVEVQVARAKLNLLTLQYLPKEGDFYNPPHTDPYLTKLKKVDVPENMGQINMVYYLNDSDGDTYFFPGKVVNSYKDPVLQVTPKKGRAVFFEPDQFHASSPPRNNMYRLVLNVNLLTTRPLPEVYKYIEEEDKP